MGCIRRMGKIFAALCAENDEPNRRMTCVSPRSPRPSAAPHTNKAPIYTQFLPSASLLASLMRQDIEVHVQGTAAMRPTLVRK